MKSKDVVTSSVMLFLCLYAGCKSLGNDRSVTVKNTTDKSVVIVRLSTASSPELPVDIPAGSEKVLQWVRTNAEAETFCVKYDGNSYEGDTGYSQGSSKYTITFSVEGGNLVSQTIHSGLADGMSQTKPVPLKLLE